MKYKHKGVASVMLFPVQQAHRNSKSTYSLIAAQASVLFYLKFRQCFILLTVPTMRKSTSSTSHRQPYTVGYRPLANILAKRVGLGFVFNWEGSVCHNKAVPGSLPSQAQCGTPCGFNQSNITALPYRIRRAAMSTTIHFTIHYIDTII